MTHKHKTGWNYLTIWGVLLGIVGFCIAEEYITDVKLPPGVEKLGYKILNSDIGKDIFYELSSTEITDWSVEDEQLTISQRIEKLHTFREVIHVNIRLVGFDGDGNQNIKLDEQKLESYFDSIINTHDRVTLINPDPRYTNTAGNDHDLNVERDFLFSVTKAPRVLNTVISTSINKHLRDSSSSVVPLSAIHSQIRADFNDNGFNATYTVYILNPKRSRNFYVYAQDLKWDQSFGEIEEDECLTTYWLDQQRFMFIDLSAGPLEYGPQTTGEGIVTEDVFPNVEDGPSVLMTDIVAMVHKFCDYVISPSLYYVPTLGRARTITIDVFDIVDVYGDADTDDEEDNSFQKFMDRSGFLDMASQNGYKIEMRYHHMPLNAEDSDHKAFFHFLYANSLKQHTSSVAQGSLRAKVHSYLDSTQLHTWLVHYLRSIYHLVDAEYHNHVIPVFLFNFKTSANYALLDRFHQALAFNDMVIAVQGPGFRIAYDYACDEKVVYGNPADANRAILAGLLSTVFGISPSYQRWDRLHQKVKEDYFFVLGNTPFGDFSKSNQLSFALKDLMNRNVMLSTVHDKLTVLREDFERFLRYGIELQQLADEGVDLNKEVVPSQRRRRGSPEVYSESEWQTFRARWNLMKYKFKEVQHYMTLNEYDKAKIYLDSIINEYLYFKKFFRIVSQSVVQSYLSCTQQDGISWTRASFKMFFISSLLLLAYFLITRGISILFTRKAKVP